MGAAESPSRLRRVVVGFLLAVLAYGSAVLLLVGIITVLDAVGVEPSALGRIGLSVLTLQVIGIGGVSLLYLRYRGLSIREWVGVRLPSFEEWMYVGAGYVLALLAAMIAVVILLTGVLVFDFTPPGTSVNEFAQEDERVLLLLAVLSILIVGPAEELLFRGIIQRSLREAFGPIGAIGIATVIFALVHVPNYTGPAPSIMATVALLVLPSLVFATLYEYTGNVVVPAVVHGLYNATLMGFGYLSLRYGEAAITVVPLL